MLIAYGVNKKVSPHQILSNPTLLTDFQNHIRSQRIETYWSKSSKINILYNIELPTVLILHYFLYF
jgi:hypothetical protein